MATKKKTKRKTVKKANRRAPGGKARASKKVASGDNPAFDLIVTALRKNKNVEYAAIKEQADRKGLTIYPVMFGRAKAMLGLVPTKRRAKKAGKRGPGRPRKTPGRGPGRPKGATRRGRPPRISSPLDAIQDLVTNLEDQERENQELRATMEQIRDAIAQVVGGRSPSRTRRA